MEGAQRPVDCQVVPCSEDAISSFVVEVDICRGSFGCLEWNG